MRGTSGIFAVLTTMVPMSRGGGRHPVEPVNGTQGLVGAVVLGDMTYTPVATSPNGCVLYSIRIRGRRAPAGLVYQSVEGEFSYAPPDECVRSAPSQEPEPKGELPIR